jgi:MbtH protein
MVHTHPLFRVVVNDDEQYALWPLHRDGAPGWRDTGVSGSREACLGYVSEVWRDMRPKRLRAPDAR